MTRTILLGLLGLTAGTTLVLLLGAIYVLSAATGTLLEIGVQSWLSSQPPK